MARVNRSMSQITRPPASSTTPGSSRAIRPRFALSKSVRSAKSADIRVHAPVATTVDDSVQHSHIERWLGTRPRSEEHTSELQSRQYLVCRLLLEKKQNTLQIHLTYKI